MAEAPPLNQTDEPALAERVIAVRNAWVVSLGRMAEFYKASGQDYKEKLVANAQARFDPIRTYQYFLDAEVPPANLQPTELIPAAENLFNQALSMHKEGKILPLVVDYDKERQALMKFLDLIHAYPTSTRIALSAYYIGDIYKEYFNEDYRAILWYERAWNWDPNITKPARFQEAVVYDLRFHNRGKAVDLYRQVLAKEPFNSSNIDYATKRIRELTAPSGQ